MKDINEEMKHDRIEKIGNSVIQHGPFNNRIYLMKFSADDYPQIVSDIEKLAVENNYSKIFLKIPQYALGRFLRHDFHIEAFIPDYYPDEIDAVFVSKFPDPDRNSVEKEALDVFNDLLLSQAVVPEIQLEENFSFRKLFNKDKENIVSVYKEVFKSYPFPVHDPGYIEKTMNENFVYYGIFYNTDLVAVSSSEIDFENRAVEMTDFAVRKNYRGKKFALLLLQQMEKEMEGEGIITFFTIARLNSPAMNKTFINSGYNYSGTLIKNTNISGKIESMNVLYKKRG